MPSSEGAQAILSTDDLITGSSVIHDITIPGEVLSPQAQEENVVSGTVRLRPLTITALTSISKAAQDDPGLVSLLLVNQSLIDPKVTVEQVRHMHVGLVQFLVEKINLISGLTAQGGTVSSSLDSSFTKAHILLAKHFGWTPQQVSQLTPGQVAVYLAGIEKLLQVEELRG